MRMKIIFLLLITSVIGLSEPDSEPILTVETYLATNGVHAGENFSAAVVVKLQEPWHVNSSAPSDEFLIPTKLAFINNPNLGQLQVAYPELILKKFAFSETPLAVYENEFIIRLTGSLTSSARNPIELRGLFTYQGCNDNVCLPPDTTPVSLHIPILDSAAPTVFQHEQYFPLQPSESAKGFDVGATLMEKGYLLTFLLIFVGGLALNLTPCVYPLIPVTVSYFGGQTANQTGRRFLLALIYVLGIAVVNSLLGTLAALSGGLLGTLLTNPIVLIALALIMVTLALSMFGLYEFNPPNFLMNLAGNSRSGYFGALIMGLTMGIVAAPCIGPFVLGLLTYVATVGRPVLGFALFFTLSLGLGVPFLILAFFSSKLDRLPRSGEWMVGVRAIFGWALIGMAIYFLNPLLPGNLHSLTLPGFLIIAGVYLVLFDRHGQTNRIFTTLKNCLALAAIIVGVWAIRPLGNAPEKMAWENFGTQKFETALQDGRPIILDFYADWCIPCKELDKITFTDPQVVAFSRSFALFKIDLTSAGSPAGAQLKKQFNIRGVPSIIFIDRNGQELPALRLTGFEQPEAFRARMQKAL